MVKHLLQVLESKVALFTIAGTQRFCDFTNKVKLRGGVVSEFVCCNTFSYIWPLLENQRSEGGRVYIFGKVSSLGVQKCQNQSHESYKRKVIATES